MFRAVLLSVAVALVLTSCRSLTGPAMVVPNVEGTQSSPEAQSESEGLSPVHRDDATRGALNRLASPPTAGERSQVPVVTRIDAVTDARGLHVILHLRAERRGDQPFYGPRTPGGWQFQMFLNVDRNPSTGYSGFEYLTRDSEVDLEPGTIVLRRTDGGGGPGGWGDALARLPVIVTRDLVTFTVPLNAIDDDGVLDFGVDMYATVLGGDDGVTPVAHIVRYYIGTSDRRWRDGDETFEPIAAR